MYCLSNSVVTISNGDGGIKGETGMGRVGVGIGVREREDWWEWIGLGGVTIRNMNPKTPNLKK